MIKKVYKFTCADCPTKGEYKDKDEARAFGWAIASGGKECYCPACAFRHRSPGRLGVQKPLTGQISFDEAGNA